MFGRLTVTVKHPLRVDRYGDPIPGTATADALLPGCLIAPRASTETSDLQTLVDTRMVLYAPPGASMSSADRLVLPGYTGEWQVEGDPNRWDLSGFPGGGVEVVLRKVN